MGLSVNLQLALHIAITSLFQLSKPNRQSDNIEPVLFATRLLTRPFTLPNFKLERPIYPSSRW